MFFFTNLGKSFAANARFVYYKRNIHTNRKYISATKYLLDNSFR